MARLATRRGIRLQPESGRRFIPVPEELVDLYGPLVGPKSLVAWLVLRLAAERGQTVIEEDPAEFVAQATGLTPLEGAEALRQLILYELVQVRGNGEMLVKEPLSRGEFQRRFGKATVQAAQAPGGHPATTEAGHEPERSAPPPGPGTAEAEVAAAGEGEEVCGPREPGAARPPTEPEGASAGRPAASGSGPASERGGLPKDVRSVLDWYHQRIGLISESQFQRLCEWISTRGMNADVVALAIEETARSAQYASFSYLEGVLRNWYNHGVRTWDDLQRRRFLSTTLASSRSGTAGGPPASSQASRAAGAQVAASAAAPGASGAGQGADSAMTGVPNAEAYRPVDPERVKRWKELYANGR